jgi:hypothetical protein
MNPKPVLNPKLGSNPPSPGLKPHQVFDFAWNQLCRLSIEQIRRKELSDAAYWAMQVWGLPGTILVRVAAKAGVSKGIVLHYFWEQG